ncbi:glycerophosphoryl diester phosphodiesterase [Desulfonema ishimotonii]|uniref:Glycerophosphoryl diester phosphodiesterase n=1 Tax=Desulfonema ishimotonii TaxID=45657 RepID=A0A401G0M1_9BACT|nr:glycerophosphodiester phosphodiesterase family protein [Desulfonema ishimotonii]GBC62761.1 glycerophosphoryl diester phosphodiesterase [Desulfonema ishimotonii]
MVLNIAHRGARSIAPENTLIAARKGLEAGADLWETDVSVTGDGALILFHDRSPDRTTDVRARFPGRASRKLWTFTLAELRTLDAGSFFVESDPFGQIAAGAVSAADQVAFRGEKIPTLEEALIFTRAANWRINLELKTLPAALKDFPIVDRVLALADAVHMPPEHLILSSTHHPWLREVQEKRPEIEVQALIGVPVMKPMDWGGYEFPIYNANSARIDEDQIRAAIARGRTVNLFTVNAEAEMRRFIRAGVSGIITDFPQRLARIIASPGE